MNILIISSSNPYKTAGIVAYDLYKGLRDRGNNTRLLIKTYGKYTEKDIICMESFRNVLIQKVQIKFNKLINYLNRVKISPAKTKQEYSIQDLDQTVQYYKTKKILKKVKLKPDVIFYLFPQRFLNTKNLYELNKITGAPIYWYLMDSAPLTGGCHYSWNCKRYITGCGKCPALFSNDENDQTSINLKYKYKYISKTDIHIIAGTEWQNKKAIESLLFKEKPVYKVLISIDSNIFNYLSKDEGKKKHEIPSKKKVIFFGSTSLSNKRKGIKYLIEALNILRDNSDNVPDNILLLIAGYDFDHFQNILPFEHKFLGFLETNEQLASAFHAADVFVCPSIEDSGPMMINQSIMCGTPVVSFEMGVAEDLVHTGKTGYRAKLFDSADLAKGINDILFLNHDEHQKMSSDCRKFALANFTVNVSIEKIANLIKN